MSSIPCDVVLLADPRLAAKAIKTSEQLESLGSHFTLKDGSYYPHASLYMFQLGVDDIEEAKQALERIAEEGRQLNLKPTRIYQSHGYIDVEYEKTNEVSALQNNVLGAINPIRKGMRAKDVARLADSDGLEKENYTKYGYKAVGELFRPHITFTRFTDPRQKVEPLEPSNFVGTFTHLGLFEMGDNGTCIRKIAEFKL